MKIGADAWDERFSGDGWAYGTEPNEWIRQIVKPLNPRPNQESDNQPRALVPADGEGRNAVWIASLGYKTDVFDLSSVGKEKCAKLANERGVTVHYEVDDLEVRDFPVGVYDLIACSWFHVPWKLFCEHYPRMLASLKSGGEFVCEGYHTSQLEMQSGGPKNLDLLWDLEEVLEVIGGGFDVLHATVDQVVLDESDLHRGPANVVRFHLFKQ